MAQHNLSELIAETVSQMKQQGLAYDTIYAYSCTLRALMRYCEAHNIEEYTEETGARFLELFAHKDPPFTDDTRHAYRTTVDRLNCALNGTRWCPRRKQAGKYVSSCFDAIISNYGEYMLKKSGNPRRKHSILLVIARFLRHVEDNGCTELKDLTPMIIYTVFKVVTDKKGFRDKAASFLRYAYKHGLMSVDLSLIMPSVPHYTTVPSVYTPEEVEMLIRSIDRSTPMGKRDYAILIILARLGIRAVDIANLTFDCLHLDKRTIEFIQQKTRQPQTLVLLDEVEEGVFDYINNARPESSDEHIFLNKDGYGAVLPATVGDTVRRIMSQTAIKPGNRKLGSHSMRASLATALIDEGNDYAIVQKVLGHLNVQSTKSYVRADVEQLRINALPVLPASGNFQKFLESTEEKAPFRSILKSEIEDYLELRKNQGYVTKNDFVFKRLDSYLVSQNVQDKALTPTVIDGWLEKEGEHIHVNTVRTRISVYTGFAKYLATLNILAFIPEPPLQDKSYMPYIFSRAEIQEIIGMADVIVTHGEPLTDVQFSMVLRILCGCGLRLSEALKLRYEDVDVENGILHILEGKDHKDRLVPMEKSVTELLRLYINAIQKNGSKYLFTNSSFEPRSVAWAEGCFKRILTATGIVRTRLPNRARHDICLHCMRHTFAVNSFRAQDICGKNEYGAVPSLSIYLGHDDLLSTQRYLHMTAENSMEIINASSEYTKGMFPEVPQ